MRSTSPISRTPQSPVGRAASPRPPLHPNTNLASSPIRSRRAMTPPPTGTLPKSPAPQTGKSAPYGAEASMSVIRRKSSSHSLDQPRMVNRVKLPKESIRSLFWSPLGLLVFFAGALTITAITQTGFSMNWIYNGKNFPIISCPSKQFLTGPNENIDGTHCLLLLVGVSKDALLNVDSRITIGNPSYYGSVVYAAPCSVAGSMVSPAKCTFTSWSNDFPSPPSSGVACKFNVMPVCDGEATVSVGQILTLQGLGLTGSAIVLIYFLIALVTTLRYKTSMFPSRQRRLDVSRAAADASAREMTKYVEHEWSQLEFERTVNKKKRLTNQPANIAELFTSNSWRYKVSKCLGAEARARRNVVLLLQKLRTGLAVWGIFFLLTVGIMQLFLFVLPVNYFATTQRSVFGMLLWDQASLTVGETVNAGSTWVDFVAIADLVIEFFLLFFSVVICGVLQWPALPVKAPHVMKVRASIRRGSEVDFNQAAADGAIYAETVAAVILVRENCTSDHRKNSLVKRIQTLLTMFPPESIFVVDSHPHSLTPVDCTWETVHGISPLIRYCFVPETDSRLFALYWFSSVWFPFLLKSGQVERFSHFLVLAPTDDEGGILPLLPADLTLPRENLSVNADNLRALHIPVSAASAQSGSTSCCWVPCQDFDLKFRAIRRLAESRLGSCTEVELSVAVWEREALIRALSTASSRDTSSPLQQMQTGLEVVKMRARNHIKSTPHAFVNVCVPTSFTDLATHRFRSNYAGDIVRVGCALRELFSVFSLCNVYSWSIKPFLLLGTVISGICQFARPFVIGTLAFRDPVAIGCLAVLALVIMLLLELILLLVFSSRSDLRQKWPVMSIITYPAYRAVKCWFIELPTLFEYIMGGCVRNASIRLEKRVRDLQDMPACPPCHVVNWFTVWKVEEDVEFSNNEKNRLAELEETMSSVGVHA